MNTIKFKLNGGYAPTKNNPSDAGWDLYSPEEVIIRAGDFTRINLGISMEIPGGCYGAIESRSGLATKGIQCHRGIIDSGYRGEIGVMIFNHGRYDYHISKGDRICQLIIHKFEHAAFAQVEELSQTDRGTNGFGSSGR